MMQLAAVNKTARRIVIAGAVLQRDAAAGDNEKRSERSDDDGGAEEDGVATAVERGGARHGQQHTQQQHTQLGVVLSSAVLVAIACVAVANSTQFFASNVDVASALQPSSPGAIDAFSSDYAPFVLAAEALSSDASGGAEVPLAKALGGLSTGLLVNVRASGARCAAVSGVAYDLRRGVFAHSVTQDAASGEASHSFSCADCVPHDLSTLRFSLSRECEASAVVTVSAVGAWGSVTATCQVVGGAAFGGSVSLTVPVTFQALQDLSWSEYASTLLASGVQTAGGKSARGLSVGAAQDLAQTAPPAGADPQNTLPLASRTVDFVLSIPLQPTFVLATLTLHTGWSGFVSSIVGLAGFVPVGGAAFVLIEAAGALLRPFCAMRASARVRSS